MHDVEPDDVPERVGEEDDPQNRDRREEPHDTRKERGHYEKAASDDGRERRQGSPPELALRAGRAHEEQRSDQAQNENENVECEARRLHARRQPSRDPGLHLRDDPTAVPFCRDETGGGASTTAVAGAALGGTSCGPRSPSGWGPGSHSFHGGTRPGSPGSGGASPGGAGSAPDRSAASSSACGSRAARRSLGRSISTAFAPGASDLEAVKVELRWIRRTLDFLAAFVLVQRP